MKNHFVILEKGSAIPLFSFFVRDFEDLKKTNEQLSKALGDGSKRVLVTGTFNDAVFGGQFDDFLSFCEQFKDCKTKTTKKDGKEKKDN